MYNKPDDISFFSLFTQKSLHFLFYIELFDNL